MSDLPKPDQVKAPPDDRNHDRAPIHPARELDRVFLDHYAAGNLPLKSRRTAVLQIFLLWGFIASAAAFGLNPRLLPRLIDAVHHVGALVGSLPGWAASWAGVSLAIFLAASISSTVGFAFSAVAAAMILSTPPALSGPWGPFAIAHPRRHRWRYPNLICAAAAIVSLAMWAGSWTAQAHRWYPRECCGDGDCAVATGLVHLAGGWLRITTPLGTVEVPGDFPIQASPDEHVHACLRRGEYDDGDSGWMVICLFLPAEV